MKGTRFVFQFCNWIVGEKNFGFFKTGIGGWRCWFGMCGVLGSSVFAWVVCWQLGVWVCSRIRSQAVSATRIC